jgi:hypothetical protein
VDADSVYKLVDNLSIDNAMLSGIWGSTPDVEKDTTAIDVGFARPQGGGHSEV